MIQSKYALIENNLFQNLSGAAIRIENGVDWGEGFRADNIEIKNNRIENCGYDTSYINESNSAAISVDFSKIETPCTPNGGFCGTTTSTWRAHSNIRIIDNTILYNRRAFYMKNIDGLTLTNNFICHRDEDITLGNGETPIELTSFNNGNVTIEAHNYALPDSNIQFLLNETASSSDIVNYGSNQTVGLQINTNGGTIDQGFIDDEVGYSFNINTSGNGNLRLINTADNSSFPGPSEGAARTYALWIKPAQSAFQTLLFSGGPTDGEVFSIQMENNNNVLRVTDNDGNFVRMSDMPLDIGEWNHVAVTVPQNNSIFSIQLYKNGVSSEETHQGEDKLLNTASNKVEFFPRYNGLASDIRVFDYKLCGGDIESIFNDKQTTLSADDNNLDANKLKVFPTITSNTVFFSEKVTSIKVISLLGKILISKNNVNIKELDISKLTTGLYILHINNNQIAKILKN